MISMKLGLILAVLLVGCGTDPTDSTPPSIRDTSNLLISVFDTLFLEFSEELKSLDPAQVQSSPELTFEELTANKWAFLAPEDSRIAGFPTLVADTTYELTFSTLEDGAGNTASDQAYSFRTLPFPDSDFRIVEGDTLSNNQVSRSDFLGDADEFITGVPLDSGQVFCGILEDKARNVLFDDHVDYYRIELRAGDSLYLKLSAFQKDLDLMFMGPQKRDSLNIPPEYKTLSENTELADEELFLYVDADAHLRELPDSSVVEASLPYWIKVYYKMIPAEGKENQTPYRLELRRTRKGR